MRSHARWCHAPGSSQLALPLGGAPTHFVTTANAAGPYNGFPDPIMQRLSSTIMCFSMKVTNIDAIGTIRRAAKAKAHANAKIKKPSEKGHTNVQGE